MSPLHGYRSRIEGAPPEAEAPRSPVEQSWAYGPCLYLGRNGQRCERSALEGGYCARHTPGGEQAGPGVWFRRLAALLVAGAILWPIIEDFLNELSHWHH